MKRLLTVIAMVVVLVGAATASSVAGVKTIKPDQLKPYRSTSDYYQSSDYVLAVGTTYVDFVAEVKLPIGKTVKKLTYFHRGYTLSSVYTSVALKRVKMGENAEYIQFADSADNTGTHVAIETDYVNLPKIKSGYTYFVEVRSGNNNSLIEGIKITYK